MSKVKNKKSSNNKTIIIVPLIGVLFLLSLFIYVRIPIVSKDIISIYKEEIFKNETVNNYLNHEIELERIETEYKLKYTTADYTLTLTGNNNFNDLSKEEKYKVLISVYATIQNAYRANKFACGGEVRCELTNVSIKSEDDIYEVRKFDPYGTIFNLEMVINSEEHFIPESVEEDKNISTVDKNISDTETTVQDKDGNDWINLSENQKYHAVSNALYFIDLNGYTILEGEYYYIDILDEYYSDSSNRSTPVDEALANAGILSGTIY